MPRLRRSTTRRRALAFAGLVTGSMALAGCGVAAGDPGRDAGTETVGDLMDCPSVVTIRLPGDQVAEYAPLYQLLGEPYSIDRDGRSVTGPLVAAGEDTGLDIEISTGPPGDRPTVLYDEPRIWMTALSTADAIAYSGDYPAIGVFALLDVGPGALPYPALDAVAEDPGFRPYPAVLSVLPEFVDGYRECLNVIVPILQKAELDFFADPDATTATLVQILDGYDAEWQPDIPTAAAEVERVRTEAAGNGANDVVGDIDLTRVAEFIDLARPLLTEAGLPVADALTPADLYTNVFIDEGLGFAS